MSGQASGVIVGRLLQSRPETVGLDLEILAGSGGLDRCITSPYVQKTGLALVEIAARNQLLRGRGHHPARTLAQRLEHQLQLAGMDEPDESESDELPAPGEET